MSSRSTALPGGLHLWRVDLVGAGTDNLRDAGEGVVGIERAGIGEDIGGRRRARAHVDAAIGAGTPIIGSVHELNGAAGTIGRDVEGNGVFQGHIAVAGHTRD